MASYPTSTKTFVTKIIGDVIEVSHVNDLQDEVAAIETDLLNGNVFATKITTGLNAAALSTGTVPLARLTSANTSANGVVDTTTQTFAGNKTFQNTVTFQSNTSVNGTFTLTTTTGLSANGSIGTNGQLLYSNGTTAYWSTPAYASPDDVIALAIALG